MQMLSVTYYTASPPLPVPSATTSTLLLLFYWLRERYFSDLNSGDNSCEGAYSFLLAFMCLCLAMVSSLMSTNVMAFSIEAQRYNQLKLRYGDFRGAGLVLTLAVGMMCCYSGALGGRIVTSFVSVNCFRQFDMTVEQFANSTSSRVGLYYPDIHYPFQPGTANITSKCALPGV